MRTTKAYCAVLFTRFHFRGILEGITTEDIIRHVDRWHAAQWIKGIRKQSRLGNLDYRLKTAKSHPVWLSRIV